MYEEKNERVQEAGNLHIEIQELQKLIPDSAALEAYSTSTRSCGLFLTLYCC